MESVTPTLTYFVGTGTSGTNLGSTAPSTIGTYTVVANFAGSTDFAAASSNPVTFDIGKTAPTVTVSDLGGTFTGSPFPATALVNGAASLETVTPTLTYFVGTGTSGTNLGSTAPSAAGTYTVVANFAGSTDFGAASSSPLTFVIAKVTPNVMVSDAGGVFMGTPFPASAEVNGAASLEGVAPTLTYFVGNGTSGTNLGSTAPSAAGTYTVVASFAGSADYTANTSSPVLFGIGQATPTVTVSDAGGTFTGNPLPATALVNGAASLETVTPTLTYFVGTGTSGTNLGSTAPGAVGTYTVVANFAGSTDFVAASSTPLTFNISHASPTVTVSDAGGTFTGDPFSATALVNGAATLEGVAPSLQYYVGSPASGSPSSTAPTAAGTYTVVASFPGSSDYNSASSAPVAFTISQATPTVTVSDAGGPFTGNPYPATATVTGVSGTATGSLESVTPTLTYFVGAGTSGTNLGSTAPGTVGTYTVVANFAGSADYASASSAPLAFTINAVSTGATVTIPLGITATAGQAALVNVPVTATGLDTTSGLLSADFVITYNPALLTLSTVSLSDDLSANDWSISKNLTTLR